MRLEEIISSLEHLLETTDWKKATPTIKHQVVELLKIARVALQPPIFRRLAVLARSCLGVTPHEFHIMLTHPPDKWDVELTPPLPPEYPKDGWLGLYLKFTETSEAPLAFHFWVGVICIGAVLKRNLFYKRAHDIIYPNHFVILLDESAVNRKSSAVRIGRRFVEEVGTVNIIADKTTPEALLEAMASRQLLAGKMVTDCYGLVYAEELAFFLGKQSYNEGMVIILTDLADCPPGNRRYRTRGKGTIHLIDPGLSFLGASTPDWLQDSIPASAFGGGFMSRILFVKCTEVVERIISRSEPDQTIKQQLVDWLKVIATIKGEIKFTKEGEIWFDNFYYQQRANQPEDRTMIGYHNRKHDHLVRLATVLTVAKGGAMELTPTILEEAFALLNLLEIPMPDAFLDKTATPVGQATMRIVKQLKLAGGRLNHSTLLRKNAKYLNSKGFRESIETLKEAGMVEEVRTSTGRWYISRE